MGLTLTSYRKSVSSDLKASHDLQRRQGETSAALKLAFWVQHCLSELHPYLWFDEFSKFSLLETTNRNLLSICGLSMLTIL